jgi:hypothetical protein
LDFLHFGKIKSVHWVASKMRPLRAVKRNYQPLVIMLDNAAIRASTPEDAAEGCENKAICQISAPHD